MRETKLAAFSANILACASCLKGALPRVSEPRGKLEAGVVFIVPAPDRNECADNALLTSETGYMFSSLLIKYAEFDIDSQAVVVPLTFCHTTLNKACVTSCNTHVRRFLKNPVPRVVVIVGNDVYKAFFQQGSMPELLCGNSFVDSEYPYDFFFMSDHRKMLEIICREEWDRTRDFWETRFKREAREFGKYIAQKRKGR